MDGEGEDDGKSMNSPSGMTREQVAQLKAALYDEFSRGEFVSYLRDFQPILFTAPERNK